MSYQVAPVKITRSGDAYPTVTAHADARPVRALEDAKLTAGQLSGDNTNPGVDAWAVYRAGTMFDAQPVWCG